MGKEDSFVPIKNCKSEKNLIYSHWIRMKQLLRNKTTGKIIKISGVMNFECRSQRIPLKDEAAHLVGYVQNVTAEDLEKHAGEGYTNASVIGKTGLEGVYEKELKGEMDAKYILLIQKEKRKSSWHIK
mgnify:CR=1 FL=1